MQIQWPNKVADAFLREWYNDTVKIDPKCLAVDLHKSPFLVETRLRQLRLKRCVGYTSTKNVGRPRKVQP